jgi:hypothetical protein
MTPRRFGPAPGSLQFEKTKMIRAIALATMFGALVASVAVYTIGLPGWRNVTAPLFGRLDRRAETAITAEDWPICTTMTSVASDADWAQLDPDFKAGKKALGAEDWNGAIAALELAALRDPLNADIRTTSAMPIGGCVSWGRLLAIISRR